MADSACRVRQILHEVLRRDAGEGWETVARSAARVAGAGGAVLWTGDGATTPSPVALWFAEPADAPAAAPDAATMAAFRTGTLGLPADAGDRVLAAIPVGSSPDGIWVLTLFGDGELSTDGFAAVVDLIGILPELGALVRERLSLELVRRCDEILHDADVEGADRPLSRDRLSHHLGRVCTATAEILRYREVSLLLDGALVATSGVGPGAAGGGTVVPIMTSGTVRGAIVCAGAEPAHPDPAVVALVAPQVGRYWNTWLQRRTTVAENESWRQLAAGVTELNQLLEDQLGRRNPDDDRVFRGAIDVVRRVIPDAAGGAVWRPDGAENRLTLATATDEVTNRPVPAPAMSAFESRQQLSTTEAGWLIHTPLRASRRRYGVLEVHGSGPAPPANSPQVCRIVADHLGLYEHLRQTRCKLEEAKAALGRTVRSQAEALEDLEHQLVSPLLAATHRTERLLHGRQPDGRTEQQLRAVRGLCRKSSRVASSAGVFAALSKGEVLRPKLELLYADDLLRILIAGADDAQLLTNPRRSLAFDVDRDTVRALGRRFIEADRSFLEQCVGNLVDNAAKYSFANTRVDIGSHVGADGCTVSVRNTGLPLDDGDAERCLERNWRGAAARNATGEGSGLGLWIVDHLMRCMKGRVRLSSTEDTTTAMLVFPLA